MQMVSNYVPLRNIIHQTTLFSKINHHNNNDNSNMMGKIIAEKKKRSQNKRSEKASLSLQKNDRPKIRDKSAE